MEWLKQSTAATVVLGPFLDSTDGDTQETALTIAQADIRLSKNGGAFAQTNNVAGATHMEFGNYSVPLDTTDTGTLGRIRVSVHESGALAVWKDFLVVPANVYDSMVLGTDVLTADVTQIGGVAQSATDLKDFADTGYDPATHKVQGVVLADTTTDVTNQHADDLTNAIWTDAKAGYLDHAISTVDTVVDGIQTDLSNATDGLGALKTLIDAVPTVSEIQTEMEEDGASLLDTIRDELANGTDGLSALKALIDTNKTELDGLQGADGKCVISTDAQDLSATLDVNTKTATATALDLILKDSTFALAIADAIWDEVLTGAAHNIATSAGRRLRELGALTVHTGTAQAGANSTITLDAGASATDDIYVGSIIVIIGGTGIYQSKTIVAYNGTTKVATIDGVWLTNPDATSEFNILATHDIEHLHHGTAQAGANGSITLDAGASAVSDFYNSAIIHTVTGTGAGQCRLIADYDGGTKIVLVTPNWITNPDATTVFHIGCRARSDNALIEGVDATDQINAECGQALSDYGANTTVPDAAGTAAALHATTDGKIDTNKTELDGLQGTDGKCLISTDAQDLSGTFDVNTKTISGSSDAADKLEASAETIEIVTAIAGTLSTTEMTTNLTETTDDHYNGRIIIWTSGVLLRQATDITDYDGTSKKLTFTAVTEAPSANDTFIIV